MRHLAHAVAAAGHDVVVAAPRVEASGSSAALTAVARRAGWWSRGTTSGSGSPPRPRTSWCSATSARSAPPPDVVLSGINRGANAGHAVLHSGTVGAVLTAAASGRSALAVSLDVLSLRDGDARAAAARRSPRLDTVDDETRNWATAADLAVTAAAAAFTQRRRAPCSISTCRTCQPTSSPGLRRGSLASFGQVQVAIAEAGEGFVRTSVEETGARSEPGTDLAFLADGYASVTPIRAIGEDP